MMKKILVITIAILAFITPALAHIKPKDPSHMNPHWLPILFIPITIAAFAWMGWKLSQGLKKPKEK